MDRLSGLFLENVVHIALLKSTRDAGGYCLELAWDASNTLGLDTSRKRDPFRMIQIESCETTMINLEAFVKKQFLSC